MARSAPESSNDSRELITRSQTEIRADVENVGQAAESLASIVNSFDEVSELVASISEDTGEQADRLSAVNSVVTKFDQTTQSNAQMVDQSTKSISTAISGVERIEEITGRFVLDTPKATKAA